MLAYSYQHLFWDGLAGYFPHFDEVPKFKITAIEGPTYCSTYHIGKKHKDFEMHRTGVVLYLSIANVGSSASSIGRISVGYHWDLRPFSILWLRNTLGWFWLTNQAVALEDFQVAIGESIKIYPFLTQRNYLSPSENNTYLEIGCAINGVVYFEQLDSWGGCFPHVRNEQVKIKIRIEDVFGGRHTKTIYIPSVSFKDARKFNPSFGKTYASLRGEPLPHDTDGNTVLPTNPPQTDSGELTQ